jgi:hypothetical protein
MCSTRPPRRFGQIEGPAAENDDTLVAVIPVVGHRQHRFVRLAPDHQRIDRGEELLVAVGLSAIGGQEVEGTVRARDEPVHAGPDENRRLHLHEGLILRCSMEEGK